MARTYHVHKVAVSDEIYSALEKKRKLEKPHLKMTQYVQDVLFRYGKGEIAAAQLSEGKKYVQVGRVLPDPDRSEGPQHHLRKAG